MERYLQVVKIDEICFLKTGIFPYFQFSFSMIQFVAQTHERDIAMTDNELLLAISDIMDKKLDARIKPLENDIKSLGLQTATDIKSLKQQLTNDIESLRQQTLTDIESLKQQTKLLRLQNENEIIPRLQNIEACYTSTYERYKNSVEGYEAMRADNELFKEVVREHSEKLQKIS